MPSTIILKFSVGINLTSFFLGPQLTNNKAIAKIDNAFFIFFDFYSSKIGLQNYKNSFYPANRILFCSNYTLIVNLFVFAQKINYHFLGGLEHTPAFILTFNINR